MTYGFVLRETLDPDLPPDLDDIFCPPLIRIQDNEAKRQALKLEAQKRVPEDESD